MGNNKQALMLIIQRLGDVERAIDFAKEQADEDLWEDLLKYSETKPRFIRGLLENVGAEINPLRLIRRIKDGLEIPGLKDALIKILQASNLQVGPSRCEPGRSRPLRFSSKRYRFYKDVSAYCSAMATPWQGSCRTSRPMERTVLRVRLVQFAPNPSSFQAPTPLLDLSSSTSAATPFTPLARYLILRSNCPTDLIRSHRSFSRR